MAKRMHLRSVKADSSNSSLIASTCKYSLKVNNHRKKKTIEGKRFHKKKVGFINTPHNTSQYLIRNYQSLLENEEDDDFCSLFSSENMIIPQGTITANQADEDCDMLCDESDNNSVQTQTQTQTQAQTQEDEMPKRTSIQTCDELVLSLIQLID